MNALEKIQAGHILGTRDPRKNILNIGDGKQYFIEDGKVISYDIRPRADVEVDPRFVKNITGDSSTGDSSTGDSSGTFIKLGNTLPGLSGGGLVSKTGSSGIGTLFNGYF
jgi:hypothetical protein